MSVLCFKTPIILIKCVIFAGKPNIVSVWAENSVGLVSKAMTGAVIIDQTIPQAGTVVCPDYIQVYFRGKKGGGEAWHINVEISSLHSAENLGALKFIIM